MWTHRCDDTNRLFALIDYPPGADPEQLTQRIMSSQGFAADMAGFDVGDIVDVESVLLDASPSSPIR